MKINKFKDTSIFLLFYILFLLNSCTPQKTVTPKPSKLPKQHQKEQQRPTVEEIATKPVEIKDFKLASERTEEYLPLLKGKRVAVVTNQTGIVHISKGLKNLETGESKSSYKHIVDYLIENQVVVKKIFAPEHGFRGTNDAGEKVNNEWDQKTNLPIISLYGNSKKPKAENLQDVDVIVFDIQDVGVRFYTYISTLHYVMEAAAENNIPIIVFDRPNPNGHYIDGPILEEDCKSFVGMHPVPVVYGMTIGEYAQMINGEGWLQNGEKADLKVIKMNHYQHNMTYDLPIKPSPNLPNAQSIALYPSLCFFEGTSVSVGRGTDFAFQVFGAPYLTGDFQFTPKPNVGANNPLYNGKQIVGTDLRNYPSRMNHLNLSWLIEARNQNKTSNTPFWNKDMFINLLAGTKKFKEQIDQGLTEAEIRATWQEGIEKFKTIRAKYLLYP